MVQVGFPETRDEALAAKDRRRRQARAEIARAVRTGYVAPPPAGGLSRERVKTPRPGGSPENAPRGAPVTCRNGISYQSFRAWPGRSAASPARRVSRRGHAPARVPEPVRAPIRA